MREIGEHASEFVAVGVAGACGVMWCHEVPHSRKGGEFVHFSLLWEQVVGGSNPLAPTIYSRSPLSLWPFVPKSKNPLELRYPLRDDPRSPVGG